MRIDLNVDIGEGFAFDEELLQFATSANVSCGEHAGSWSTTCETVKLCMEKGVRIGAHPGYPDRDTMGRTDASADRHREYRESLIRQVERFLQAFPCDYIKPHGAWYNAIVRGDSFAAECLGEILSRHGLPVMMLPSASAAIPKLIREGFADRAYLPDGSLMPRSEPGAVLHDPETIAAQVLRLAGEVDSICLHGDTPNALEFAKMVRKALEDNGYEVGA